MGIANCVDHIIPHHGDEFLFRLVANWQPLTLNCNTQKHHSGEDERNRKLFDIELARGKTREQAAQSVLERIR